MIQRHGIMRNQKWLFGLKSVSCGALDFNGILLDSKPSIFTDRVRRTHDLRSSHTLDQIISNKSEIL